MKDAYERIQDVSAEMRRLEMETGAKRMGTLPPRMPEAMLAAGSNRKRARRHPVLFAISASFLALLLAVAALSLAARFILWGTMLASSLLLSIALPAAIIMLLIIVLLSR